MVVPSRSVLRAQLDGRREGGVTGAGGLVRVRVGIGVRPWAWVRVRARVRARVGVWASSRSG